MAEFDSGSVVALTEARHVNVELDHAQDVLSADLEWLGPREDGSSGASRRVRADLQLPMQLSSHSVALHKAATLDVGPVTRTTGTVRLQIAWRSATLAPLFPVFAGELTVSDGWLRLEGVYAPPGGKLGMALDRALLRIAAQRTARWFLAVVAGAVETAAEEATSSA